MRVAIYSHSIAPSIDGVCRRFTGFLHELSRSKHSTLLFTLEEDPQDIPADITVVSLDYMYFPTYPEKKVAKPTLQSFLKIMKALREFAPQVEHYHCVIHVVADAFSQCFVLAGLLLDIPVVGSFHTDIIDLLRTHGAFSFQEWFVLAKEATDSFLLDGMATTSQSFKRKLATHWVWCDHVLITAVDNKTFHPSKHSARLREELTFGDPTGFLCVYVGRISEEKHIEFLVEALRNLHGKRNTYLAIVGDGPTAPKYAAMHGKDRKIYCKPKFLSHAELAEYYASSDVHVSASEFETLGNTVLESFACGKPVVVPRTQGFQDTVTHEVNGYLFKAKEITDAVRYLQKLKDDSELLRRLGQEGLREVQAYTYASVVNDMIQWYARGISRRQLQGSLFFFAKLFVVALTVSLAFVMHFAYDIMMNGFRKRKSTSDGKGR